MQLEWVCSRMVQEWCKRLFVRSARGPQLLSPLPIVCPLLRSSPFFESWLLSPEHRRHVVAASWASDGNHCCADV